MPMPDSRLRDQDPQPDRSGPVPPPQRPSSKGDGRPVARGLERPGLSPAALAASVGISLALLGTALGSPPKEEEVAACAECLAAVAAKYTTIKYAEEIALVTTLGAVTFRMFIEGKRAREEASRSRSARPEGDGQELVRS
jgi:hypothetical protein